MNLSTVILAAGQGTRMVSQLPKVLHPLAGKPMVRHVYETVTQLDNSRILLVHGTCGERLQRELSDFNVQWVYQEQQLGTGHAVQQTLTHLDDDQTVLILYADTPLIRRQTLERLVSQSAHYELNILTARFDNPEGFGRILRDSEGNITGVVEEKDATADQKAIQEINTGILAVSSRLLKRYLPQLKANNKKHEYYLTDIIQMAAHDNVPINEQSADPFEVTGVNTRQQLIALERGYQYKMAEDLLARGVNITDPYAIDIRGELKAGMDSTIERGALISGNVTIGQNCYIGPNCVIKDCFIGDNVCIQANTVMEEAHVESDCGIGPHAHLRKGSYLQQAAKIGNYVEIKNATIGPGAKVNHLAYIGDAVVESDVNVGAGAITCNFDGQDKHVTHIKQGAFIGSNVALVAPITIGAWAIVGAGSTISQSVEDNALAISRGRQRNIPEWRKRKARSNES